MAQTMLRDYLQETEDAISNGRYEDALARCQHILDQFPDALEVQRLVGEVYLAQGQLDEAQQSFDWVLTNDPENVIVYCDRALVCERRADYDTALDCYQQAYELSRGNSHIRHEFNKLSAKVGQQGFMFSRAGLARLYMRGDLLTQAIQEWETVLVSSPDRLDARTGLLEAYWREGLNHRVEELATQILRDVPGCIKALLLLAYVTSASDIQKAQDYLKRAAALDPDFVIAQDLFADLIAGKPNDPFLAVLKRTPATLAQKEATQSAPGGSRSEEAFPMPNGAQSVSASGVSAHSSPSWPGLDSRNGEHTFSQPQIDTQPAGEESDPSPWTRDSLAHLNAWNRSDQPEPARASAPQEVQDWTAYLSADADQQENSWETSSAGLASDTQEDAQPAPWLPEQDAGRSEEGEPAPLPSFESFDSWSAKSTTSEDTNNIWSSTTREPSLSSAPAWLNMLTQGERRQMGNDQAAPSFPGEQKIGEETPGVQHSPVSPSNASFVQEQAKTSSNLSAQKEEEVESIAALPVFGDDDDESFFGPEWLKSLGAMESDEDEVAAPAPPVASVESVQSTIQAQQPVAEETWYVSGPGTTPEQEETSGSSGEEGPGKTAQVKQDDVTSIWGQSREATETFTTQDEDALWQQSSWEEAIRAAQAEQSTGNTWEESVQRVTPESEVAPIASSRDPFNDVDLASLSQALGSAGNGENAETSRPSEHDLLQALEKLEQDLRSKGFVTLEPNTLSTLAKSQEAVPPPSPATEQAQEMSQEPTLSSALAELGNLFQPSEPSEQLPAASVQPPPSQTGEPEWIASLRASATSLPPATEEPQKQHFAVEEVTYPDVEVQPPPETRQEKPVISPPPVLVPPPAPVRAEQPPVHPVSPTLPEPVRAPAARMDAFLDELETTMKRPALRLPSIPQKPGAPHGSGLSLTKNQPGERPASKLTGSNLSNQERLLKGYQHQLIGDYDDAMQEYRIIIRNAPELLDEVISNVRALLKLAPKYAAGYRVLGDAYMRQGEYLQAMEAYNKALTMAKKAKA
jgi:tetratricopeptide (TPR) repeat protein